MLFKRIFFILLLLLKWFLDIHRRQLFHREIKSHQLFLFNFMRNPKFVVSGAFLTGLDHQQLGCHS